MMTEPTQADRDAALKLCWEYGPQKPGMAAAIAALVESAREQGRAEYKARVETAEQCKPIAEPTQAERDAHEAAFAEAVRETRKAPKGCIVDDQGEVRKVVAQSMGATFFPPDCWVHTLRVEATNEEAFQACVAAKGGA